MTQFIDDGLIHIKWESQWLDFTEMEKLENYLEKHNYNYEVLRKFEFYRITVKNDNDEYLWDALLCEISYGHKEGLIEVMGQVCFQDPDFDTVEGNLTADEIIERLEKIN